MKTVQIIGYIFLVADSSAKKCYVCTGVGSQSQQSTNSFSNFFDLSSFEEAKTIEADESTLESQLCNNLEASLPDTMLETCPYQDDLCYIETASGEIEAAIELQEDIFSPALVSVDTNEEIIEMKSTQISRGCLRKNDIPDYAQTVIDIKPNQVKEGEEYKYEKQKWCDDMNELGLIGKKCVTVCLFEGCNSATSLSIGLSIVIVLFRLVVT